MAKRYVIMNLKCDDNRDGQGSRYDVVILSKLKDAVSSYNVLLVAENGKVLKSTEPIRVTIHGNSIFRRLK